MLFISVHSYFFISFYITIAITFVLKHPQKENDLRGFM